MSVMEAMKLISTDAFIALLYPLSKLVIIPADKFDEVWLYVDSVYTNALGTL